MSDPHVQREIRRVADQITIIEGVSDIMYAGEVVSLVNGAMVGAKRIPDTSAQLQTLLRLLTGNISVGQVLTEDHTESLMHVKIGSNKAQDLDRVLGEVERLLDRDVITSYRIHEASGPKSTQAMERIHGLIARRIAALSADFDAAGNAPTHEAILNALKAPAPPADKQVVADQLATWMQSEECWVELTASQAQAAATAWVQLGPSASDDAILSSLLAAFAPNPEPTQPGDVSPVVEVSLDTQSIEDLVFASSTQATDLWRQYAGTAHASQVLSSLEILSPEGDRGERFEEQVSTSFMDLTNPTYMVASSDQEAAVLHVQATGLPQLYRGLSNSVTSNQI